MSDPLARRWPGRGPWDEVVFLEGSAPDGRAFWLRHTLADGPHRRGVCAWAILTHEGPVAADQGRASLADLQPSAGLSWPGVDIDATRARGRAGAVRWDLQLTCGPRAQRMVPAWIERAGVGRTYAPARLDVRVDGVIDHPGGRWVIDGAHAVLGHVWGASNQTRSWAWAHAVVDDVLVEVLSARLGPLPPLTSIAVWIGDHAVDLTHTRALVTTRTTDRDRGWSAVARDGKTAIEIDLDLPEDRQCSTVRYVDPGTGVERTCVNAASATMHLRVTGPSGLRAWSTDRAAFELARLGAPAGACLLSD